MNYDARLAYWQRTDLSKRAQHCLANAEIDDIEVLLGYPDHKLLRISNLGPVTLKEVKAWLHQQSIPISLRLVSDEALLVELHRRLKREPTP